jgi:hypothetical protein
MPLRQLSTPGQVTKWLEEWGMQITEPASLILIGSAALLWHAAIRGLDVSLPENSMDVDPITEDESVARLAYEALIGSAFEQAHGWHVNLMPRDVLRELPEKWRERASERNYGALTVVVPAPADLIAPKLKRGEPRDRKHADWARTIGLLGSS